MANEMMNGTETLELEDNGCKGCSASVHVADETIATLIDEASTGNPAQLVDDGAYAKRMDACKSCESLQFGTTCRWCGCLVAVKAKKLSAKCPHPGGSRWA